MKKSFAVFGLGRFGGTILKEFYSMGIDAVAVDKDEAKVNEHRNHATHVFCANAIDEDVLNHIGIRNVDHAFIFFGDDLQSSILLSMILKEMGVSRVWTKAQNDNHSKVLEKIGVDRVIQPERDLAKSMVRHMVSGKIIDFIEMSKDHSMVGIVVTKKLDCCSFSELNIHENYGCTVVGIQRHGTFMISPSAEETIYKDDVLIVIGDNKDLARFERERV